MTTLDHDIRPIRPGTIISDLTTRFRIHHLTISCVFGGLLAGGAAAAFYPHLPGLAFAALGVYALYAAVVHAMGVVVQDAYVSAPLPLAKWAPFLTIARTRISLAQLIDATALGLSHGYEVVGLTTVDGQVPVLFASHEDRRAFFELLRIKNPNIKIYRVYG